MKPALSIAVVCSALGKTNRENCHDKSRFPGFQMFREWEGETCALLWELGTLSLLHGFFNEKRTRIMHKAGVPLPV